MPLYSLRIAISAATVILVYLLFYTLEPRRTAYSCRTFWSCIGLDRLHSYSLYTTQVPGVAEESLVTLRDGTTRWQLAALSAEPTILILVLFKDEKSWSSDFRSSSRTVYDFLDLLQATDLDISTISLGIWTASADQFELIKTAVGRLPFSRVTAYHRQDADESAAYGDRHNPQVQLTRRSGLAKLRNRLMLAALQDEDHVLWIDADVDELSPNIVQTMIQHSTINHDAGIITAMCHQNQMNNYDKNAWKVNFPELLGSVADNDRETSLAKLVETRIMVPELIKGTDNDAIVPLDSVGGTVLLIRGDLVRQGLTFPFRNVVGTTWGQPGWIGVETEGICYAARGLDGGGCYVLGGSHHARHTDWG
ncbi:hypothetical protein LTR17_018464 [Elasticomyces elasticus]|nr:hypothetical protein LTR17_018464 [Elasticomyces elasticus]